MTMDLRAFQHQVNDWQLETFPDSTLASVLAHLREEHDELQLDPSAEECADVFLLLLTVANKQGFSLSEAVWSKFFINRQRTWHQTKHGYRKHTEPS